MNWLKRLFARPEKPFPCSIEDPRVLRTVIMQRAFGKRMRRLGTSILCKGKAYEPVNNIAPLREPAPDKALYVVSGGKR